MAAKPKPVWRLEIGDEAPEFELVATGNTAGKGDARRTVKLSDYRGKKNVVLAFYIFAFTGG